MTDRTSISIDSKVLADGKARAARLGYPNFSKYLEYLIEEDVRHRAAHTVVREEPASYQSLHTAEPRRPKEIPKKG